MNAIFWLIETLIQLMIYAIIAAVVVNMAIAFGVADRRNRLVYTIADFLNRVTEPVLSPIRRMLPLFGNVDLSPLLAILLLEALEMLLGDLYAHLEMSGLAF